MKKIKFLFRKNPEVFIGGILILFIFLFVLLGTVLMPYNPDSMDAASKFAKISAKHLFGCDNFGRDIFSRVIVGTRLTIAVAMGTVAIAVVFGTVIGAITGYYGGIVDEVVMRINDAVLAFPSFLLALVIISVFGSGTEKVIIALGIAFTPSFARIMRAEFLRCRNLDYVRSAKLMGASDTRIIFVHILPNTLSVLLSTTVIGFNNAVLAEAGMSYLGIGVQPPASSLGSMLSDAQAFLFKEPMYAMIPGILIAILVLGFALLGDGLKKS